MNYERVEDECCEDEEGAPNEALQAAVHRYAESAPEAGPCAWYAEMVAWLEAVKAQLGGRPDTVPGPLGDHKVYYEIDEDRDDKEYALIAFTLPCGVFAEIEDSTYGNMEGFRIYL